MIPWIFGIFLGQYHTSELNSQTQHWVLINKFYDKSRPPFYDFMHGMPCLNSVIHVILVLFENASVRFWNTKFLTNIFPFTLFWSTIFLTFRKVLICIEQLLKSNTNQFSRKQVAKYKPMLPFLSSFQYIGIYTHMYTSMYTCIYNH